MIKKNLLLSFAFLAINLAGATAQTSTTDNGVVINGVTWATRNVDAPGTFAAAPESSGMFYQWNRHVGWSSTDPMVNSNGGTEWNGSVPEGTEWTAENDPCPEGWRVPAVSELQSLINSGNAWIRQNGITGTLFGAVPNTVFLPAAGMRGGGSGPLNVGGYSGYYWAATQYDSGTSYHLGISAAGVHAQFYAFREDGNSVRCVKDNISAIDVVSADDPVVSSQYYDLLGKSVAKPQAGQIYIVKEQRQSGQKTTRKEIKY